MGVTEQKRDEQADGVIGLLFWGRFTNTGNLYDATMEI